MAIFEGDRQTGANLGRDRSAVLHRFAEVQRTHSRLSSHCGAVSGVPTIPWIETSHLLSTAGSEKDLFPLSHQPTLLTAHKPVRL